VRICHDRNLNLLGDDVTETEIMRRYDISRSETNRLLEKLAAVGVVERKLGYGWRFLDSLKDSQARLEAYRFRLLIEPQGMLQPSFVLPADWAAEIRERHHKIMKSEWHAGSSVAFFEMNAAFHLGLAAASGNRYILDAVNRQNHLRRLLNYDWHHGRSRVETVCREHLEMLDRLEAGDNQIASLLMYRHIEKTLDLRPPFASSK
jgi:DNA-binding GntR family transcriptional regulator